MLEEYVWGVVALREAIKRQKNGEEPKWHPLKKIVAWVLYGYIVIASIVMIEAIALYHGVVRLIKHK